MFCPKCGTQVDNGQPFCPNCGAQFQQAQPQFQQSGYPAQPQYAPRAPMDLNKILMWVSLGLMAVAIILSFFGYSVYGTLVAFNSVFLILDLSLLAIALLLMPILGLSKESKKLSFYVLLLPSLALLNVLIEWIYTGARLSVCGIFALILLAGAVACCAIRFVGGLEHRAPRAPRPQPQYQQPQYPQYQPPQQPQYQQPAQPQQPQYQEQPQQTQYPQYPTQP